MTQFALNDEFETDSNEISGAIIGELFHVANSTNVRTPVGLFFAWHPVFVEGFNKHWHVDCYVRRTPLAKSAEAIGAALVAALIEQEMCNRPLFLSVYRTEELAGMKYGDVFEDD